MQLTDEALADLKDRLADVFDYDKNDSDDLANWFAGWLETEIDVKSYSDLIIEGNEARKTCGNCGQLCVAYKEKFRKAWVTCLHAMENHNHAMTYKQLADVLVANYDFGEKASNNTARMFVMARHWNVIEKTGENIGRCPIYRITEYGREVLANRKSLPEFLWIPARDVEIDLSQLPEPSWTFAASILPDDPNDLANKALHVEQALAAF